MDFKNVKFIKTVKGNKLIIGALALGLMLLIIPWGSLSKSKNEVISVNAGESTGSVPEFSLREEEKRLESALSKIEGAGNVSVVLTLETGSERRLATDTDSSHATDADGSTQVREKSETVTVSNEAVTVIYVYPKYRGALVIASGSSPAVKLQITQAVSALTGLSTDRITVVKGSA